MAVTLIGVLSTMASSVLESIGYEYDKGSIFHMPASSLTRTITLGSHCHYESIELIQTKSGTKG